MFPRIVKDFVFNIMFLIYFLCFLFFRLLFTVFLSSPVIIIKECFIHLAMRLPNLLNNDILRIHQDSNLKKIRMLRFSKKLKY